MISQAAGQLLHAVNSQSEKLGSVTFSWYTIDCKTEALTDVLQSASLKPPVAAVSKDNGKETLVFRDMGRGRNMVVQGLLELEITSGQDIETVVQHVSQLLPHASHRSGTAHTVMQLIVNNPGKARQHKPPAVAGGATGQSAATADAQFGAGRVTFVCLGAMSAQHGQLLPPKSSLAQSADGSDVGGAHSPAPSTSSPWDEEEAKDDHRRYAWPTQVQEILTWLDHRRAAPPFHRSRLLLLLREVFMRRQHAAMMLLLQPSANAHAVNRQWLQFAQHWFTYRQNTLTPAQQAAAAASSASLSIGTPGPLASSAHGNRLHAGHTPAAHQSGAPALTRSLSRPRPGASTSGAQTPASQLHTGGRPRSAPGSRSASPAPASSSSREPAAPTTPYYMMPPAAAATSAGEGLDGDAGVAPSSADSTGFGEHGYFFAGDEAQPPSTPALDGENLLVRTLHGGASATALQGAVSSPPPPPPPLQSLSSVGGFKTPQPSRLHAQSTQPLLARSYSASSAVLHHSASANNSVSGHTMAMAEGKGIAYGDDFAQSEVSAALQAAATTARLSAAADVVFVQSEAALTLALEASRNEAAALRIAYQYAQDKYKETQAQLDTLLQQLKEEGATLRQRDKDRLKAALRDVKDYQIYKQVMETAMMKLQQQLESVVRQNEELRVSKQQDERQNQRQRSFSEKYSKDLVATKRKLVELEAKVAALEKQNKSLQRERDVAVTHLAQYSASSTQKASHLQEHLALRQREVDDLSIRVKIAEERNAVLDQEKQALLQSTHKEMEALRQAHAKALETLMTYQEENDALRGAIYDLTGSHQVPSAARTGKSGA